MQLRLGIGIFAVTTCVLVMLAPSAAPVSAQMGAGEAFSCVVTVSTATTLTAVGGKCAAPGPGLSQYITDIFFSASASGIAADAFPTLKYGTGTTCGTGTAIFWGALTANEFVRPHQMTTPIRIPENRDICWISSTAGSKFIVINGFIRPQ